MAWLLVVVACVGIARADESWSLPTPMPLSNADTPQWTPTPVADVPTVAPFQCDLEYEGGMWKTLWTPEWKAWCCAHALKGCEVEAHVTAKSKVASKLKLTSKATAKEAKAKGVHPPAPKIDACAAKCHYTNADWTCGERIQWSALHHTQHDKEPCDAARKFVAGQCEHCARCDVDQIHCMRYFLSNQTLEMQTTFATTANHKKSPKPHYLDSELKMEDIPTAHIDRVTYVGAHTGIFLISLIVFASLALLAVRKGLGQHDELFGGNDRRAEREVFVLVSSSGDVEVESGR